MLPPAAFHRLIAVALVALLLASAVPVTGEGSPPVPAEWSPEQVAANVRAIAVSKDARTLAVGNAFVADDPTVPDTGAPAQRQVHSAESDFRVYDLESGRLFNASGLPLGKSAVAASRDGSAVVAGGGSSTEGFSVRAYDVPDAYQEDRYASRWSVPMPGPVSGVAVNGMGTRFASIANEPSDDFDAKGVLRVHDTSGSQVMQYRGTGRLNDVAMDAEGRYIVTGGRHYEPGNERYFGTLSLFRYGNENPLIVEYYVPRNASEVTDVRMSADGRTFAAVTAVGEVYVYRNADRSTDRAAQAAIPAENVTSTALALSDDGRVVALSADDVVHTYTFDGHSLTERWNATLFSPFNALDLSGNGDVLVASNADGVYAFGPASGEAFWRVPGNAANVTLTADGQWAAYSIGDRVHAARLESRVFLLYETSAGRGTMTPPSSPVAEPFKPVTLDMLVANEGSAPERVELRFPAARDVSFAANETTFRVMPGEAHPVNVTITPGRLTPGDYAFNATVVTEGGARSNTTLVFTVAGTSDLAVSLSGAHERRVVPGANDSVLLTVFNNGNDVVDVTATVDQDSSSGDAWPTFFMGESDFSLAAGSRTTVGVIVEVPERAVNGSTNTITLKLNTPEGSTSTEVTYRVNPFLGVEVTAEAGRTKYVYGPGNSETFNVTVTNRGSVPAQFAASYETRASPERNWVADLEVSPFTLEPGDRHTIPVRVFAPRDGEPGDRATVLVEVRSLPMEGLDEASGNVTLYVNLLDPLPEPPRTGSEGRVIPAAGGLVVLAAAGVATALSRRREP